MYNTIFILAFLLLGANAQAQNTAKAEELNIDLLKPVEFYNKYMNVTSEGNLESARLIIEEASDLGNVPSRCKRVVYVVSPDRKFMYIAVQFKKAIKNELVTSTIIGKMNIPDTLSDVDCQLLLLQKAISHFDPGYKPPVIK